MTVAVLGLGAMGSRMASRLLETGHDVVVWNRTSSRSEALAAAGARVATSPADAVRSAEVVITMLFDAQAVREVVGGTGGAAEGLGPGTVLVEMSTIGPDAVHDLRAMLPSDIGIIDAPVLGSISEAEAGALTIFAGGEDEDLARARPVLDSLGTVVEVGTLGSGAAAKLVVNGALLGVLALLGELLRLGDALKLDDAAIRAVLARSVLGEQVERRKKVLDGEQVPVRFSMRVAAKDAALIAEAGRVAGSASALDAIAGWFRTAADLTDGDEDYSTIINTIRPLGGDDAGS